MKLKNKLPAIIAIIALSAFIWLTYNYLSHQYSWNLSFDHNNRQPYGSMVFDSVMSKSCPYGYQVSDTSVNHFLKHHDNGRETMLITEGHAFFNMDSVMAFVEHGGSVVFCALWWEDSSKIGVDHTFINTDVSGTPMENDFQKVTFLGDKTYSRRTFTLSRSLCLKALMQNPDTDTTKIYPLKWKEHVTMVTSYREEWPVVMSARWGKGRIVVSTLSPLFTNYGILENDNYDLIMRIMSLAGKKPVTRVRAPRPLNEYDEIVSDSEEENKVSLLKHILNDKSLSTAFYMMLTALVLYLFFTGRRKQRIIPVVKPHTNGQLNFVKQIGSLYKREHATNSVIEKKILMFREAVRRKTGVDIADKDAYNEGSPKIAQYTGLSEREIKDTLLKIDKFKRHTEDSGFRAFTYEMTSIIDAINLITKEL